MHAVLIEDTLSWGKRRRKRCLRTRWLGSAALKRACVVQFSPGAVDPTDLLRRVIMNAARLGVRVIATWPLPGLADRMRQAGFVPNPLRTWRLTTRRVTGEPPKSWEPALGDTGVRVGKNSKVSDDYVPEKSCIPAQHARTQVQYHAGSWLSLGASGSPSRGQA